LFYGRSERYIYIGKKDREREIDKCGSEIHDGSDNKESHDGDGEFLTFERTIRKKR